MCLIDVMQITMVLVKMAAGGKMKAWKKNRVMQFFFFKYHYWGRAQSKRILLGLIFNKFCANDRSAHHLYISVFLIHLHLV